MHSLRLVSNRLISSGPKVARAAAAGLHRDYRSPNPARPAVTAATALRRRRRGAVRLPDSPCEYVIRMRRARRPATACHGHSGPRVNGSTPTRSVANHLSLRQAGAAAPGQGPGARRANRGHPSRIMIVAIGTRGTGHEYLLLSCSWHERIIYRASGVKLVLCGHGKGRRDLSAEHYMRITVGYGDPARCQAREL